MTHLEQQLLNYIVNYQTANHGVSPSFEEMMFGCGITSKSNVYRVLSALEEQNRIHRVHNRARRITVLPDPDQLFAIMSDAALADEANRRGFVLVRVGERRPNDPPGVGSMTIAM